MLEYIILFLSGIGAGLVTGLIGASAVVIVVPILFLTLNFEFYLAIGVSLLTDIIASFFAFIEYWKKNKVKVYEGIIFSLISFFMIFFGSHISSYFNNYILGFLAGVSLLGLSISFIKDNKESQIKFQHKINKCRVFKNKIFSYILFASIIGLISGVNGAGGGIMMMIFFRFILNFDLKSSIGTSILAMIFIAFFSGINHYIIYPFNLYYILFSGLGATMGSFFASRYAIKTSEKKLSKIVGYVLLLLALLTICKNLYKVFLI